MSGLDCEICRKVIGFSGSNAKTRNALGHHMIMEHPLLVEQSLPEGYDKKQYMVRAEEKLQQYNDSNERLQQYTKERNMKRAEEKLKQANDKKMKRLAEAAAAEAKAGEESAFVDNLWASDVE